MSYAASSQPRWWLFPQHPGSCSQVPALELHLLEIHVPGILLLLGHGLCRAGLAGGQHPDCTLGTRAPGRWLSLKPRLLFCSLPLCGGRGFCCRLKRLNSCCICCRQRQCSADALGLGRECGLGGPEHPLMGRDPRGELLGPLWGAQGLCNGCGERGSLCNRGATAASSLAPFPSSAPLQHHRQEQGWVCPLLLPAGLSARPLLTQHRCAWLAACLGPHEGEAFPAMALGLPPR